MRPLLILLALLLPLAAQETMIREVFDPKTDTHVEVTAPLGVAGSRTMERIAEARMKGYEGDACPECGNFTLVRNGTCMKCDTCGSTTGCS